MAKTTSKARKAPSKGYNNHILVPKHEKLSDKQKQEILKEYKCNEDQLPRIRLTDPSIIDFSAKPGDVIRIIRKNKAEGESVFYRVVINE